MKRKDKALVVLSGGQDSTTCLAWAIKKWGKNNVETISFDYGSRHKIELTQAKKIARIAGVKNTLIPVSSLKSIKASALTDNNINVNAPNEYVRNLPSTFVPGRNMIFLTLSSSYAWKKNISNLITGVCQTDFSGYYDCRDVFIKECQKAINLALYGKKTGVKIHTPLMWLTKAESIKLMQKLGKINWLKWSHTCYVGKRPACGNCPACKLRIKGFKEAKIKDPIKYQIKVNWE